MDKVEYKRNLEHLERRLRPFDGRLVVREVVELLAELLTRVEKLELAARLAEEAAS